MNNKCLIFSPPADIKTKNVVRDFLYGCWCNGRRIGGMQMPPLNLLYVATVLKESGLNVQFLDASIQPELFNQLNADNFSDINFVIMLIATHSFKKDADLLLNIKSKNSNIKTIICGAHSTTNPYDCLKHLGIDFIIQNEPEFAIRDLILTLIQNKDINNLKGIGFRKENEPIVNEPYPFVEMDKLPIPDRTFLPKNIDYFNPVVHNIPYTTIQTSRGCPGKCIYCSVPSFYGPKLRVRPVEKVKEEILYLLKLGYKEIFFRDETFTAFKKRNKKLCEWIISNNIKFSWIANARVDMVDEEMIYLMKKSGCHMLKFGVESGSNEILTNIKKGTTIEQCRKVFKILNRAKIESHAHIIIGSPGETEETIKQTISFVKEINPTTASFGILTPYPGTPLFNQIKDNENFQDGSSADLEKLHTTSFYNESFGCKVPKEKLEKWVKKCYRSFYLRPSYLIRWIPRITNIKHLLRLSIAASNIFSYSITGKK